MITSHCPNQDTSRVMGTVVLRLRIDVTRIVRMCGALIRQMQSASTCCKTSMGSYRQECFAR